MKKILILMFMVLSVSVFADWAYKHNGGKISPLKTTSNKAGETIADYLANGFTVTTDRLALYNLLVSTGQEQAAIDRGIIPTAQEKILAETVFGKLEIREVFDEIILVAKVDAVAEVPATETTPLIPAVQAVAQVTLGDLLTRVLASNPKFATYWADADRGIDITYPTVVEALASFPVTLDIPALKLAILTNRQAKAK